MITLEALQVFPIEDGASGLVLASWIERSGVEGVPLRPHSILISSEEAQLLAQELNRVTEGVDYPVPMIRHTCDCHSISPFTSDGNKKPENFVCPDCGCGEEPPKVDGVKSSANLTDLHMHGLTYYRGAHCSGHQSQHQQVAVSDV